MKTAVDRKNKTGKMMLLLFCLLLIGGTGSLLTLEASEKPEFCITCHHMQPYYDSFKEGDLLAHKHAEAGISCHDCHEKGIPEKMDEGIKYVTGDYEVPMQKRDFGTRENCLKCHDSEVVKEKTDFAESNPHASHYGEQDCNQCHSMHRESEVSCKKCHDFVWMDQLPDGWKK